MKGLTNFSIKKILVAFFAILPLFSNAKSVEEDARTLTNLLEYIGRDYVRAVKDGEIINKFEYKEMKEFTERCEALFKDLSQTSIGQKITPQDSLFIVKHFDSLRQVINNKGIVSKVVSHTTAIKKHILKLGAFEMAPEEWPSLVKGKTIYQNKCARCHGKNGRGNGPMAKGLSPKPTNFLADSINGVSPFQYFNVVRLGIKGTSMRAFNELSDKDIWNVTFYISSLYHEGEYDKEKLDELAEKLSDDFTLKTLSTESDQELLKQLEGSRKEKMRKLAALRLNKFTQKDEKETPTSIAKKYLDQSLMLYKKGEKNAAKNKAIDAYLKGVEPIERELRASSPTMVNLLEKEMEAVRSSIKANKPVRKVEARVEAAKGTITKAKELISEKKFSFWSASIVSGSILLREGLEAFLIIITILSVLRAAGATHARKWVHGGWIIAILLGIASWFFTDWLIAMGGTSRELMEGVGALLAVVILLYIGFWFHSKTEAKQWKEFVENKIGRVVNERNLIGLAAISFIVVFREAFESVLFLSTLNLKVAPQNEGGIWIGALIAAIIVAIIAVLILRYSRKIPIQKLFKYSAVIISALAIIMAGNGIHELQEAGFVSITQFPLDLRVGVLGIYPSYEIIGAQLGTLAATIVLWIYSQRNPA